MSLTARPYIGTWKLTGQTLVQYTPDAPPSLLCYYAGMSKTKEHRRKYRAAWMRRKALERPEGVCSQYPNCARKTTPEYKLCATHRARSLAAKKRLKQKPKVVGECFVLTCRNIARKGLTRCVRCAQKEATYAKKQATKRRRAERRVEVREEVLNAYGMMCLCCSETEPRFLTIDHIDRYDGSSPRGGHHLYLWLVRNHFPAGFRVLCQNCNSALGLFGACPHGDLVQPLPERTALPRTVRNRKAHQKRNLRDKIQAFARYGKACLCCGESNHECLTLDHKDNDGAAHRRQLKGKPIYRWLRQNKYPSGFQVLCWNCNKAKHFGSCPHEAS